MKGDARVAHGRLRRADLDEAAFESVLGVIEPTSGGFADQFDIDRMLSRLSPGHRKAIELRYLQGLAGAPLVEALGVASAEAARARVFRAVQALRDLYDRDGSEVDR